LHNTFYLSPRQDAYAGSFNSNIAVATEVHSEPAKYASLWIFIGFIRHAYFVDLNYCFANAPRAFVFKTCQEVQTTNKNHIKYMKVPKNKIRNHYLGI
jgi:hypothetical protein